MAERPLHDALRKWAEAMDTRDCPGCTNGWSEDENWSAYSDGPPAKDRTPGDGLIPCGFCNHGGWDHDPDQPIEPWDVPVAALALLDERDRLTAENADLSRLVRLLACDTITVTGSNPPTIKRAEPGSEQDDWNRAVTEHDPSLAALLRRTVEAGDGDDG